MIPEKIQLQKKKKKFENYSSKYTPIIFKKSWLRLFVVSHVHMMIMEENEMGSQKKKKKKENLRWVAVVSDGSVTTRKRLFCTSC